MIHFIDLTDIYYPDKEIKRPCCAFLNTIKDRFLKAEADGTHVFLSLKEIREHWPGHQLTKLVPEGFFTITKPPDMRYAIGPADAPQKGYRAGPFLRLTTTVAEGVLTAQAGDYLWIIKKDKEVKLFRWDDIDGDWYAVMEC